MAAVAAVARFTLLEDTIATLAGGLFAQTHADFVRARVVAPFPFAHDTSPLGVVEGIDTGAAE